MSIVFRDVCPADAAQLLAIYAPYVENTAISFEYEVPSVEEFKGRIENTIKKYPYIAACDEGGRILGYAYAGVFHARKAYDRSVETSIYVASDIRRGGVGRALYAELERQLLSQGILNMYACIAAPRGEDENLNEDSLRFHEAMGFSLVGRFTCCGFKFGKWYDMVWMEKLLGEHTGNPPAVRFRGEA